MSVTSSGLHRRWSTVAGYYSHTEGPNLVDPLVTGTRFPHLVELHESQHSYLALANGTDGFGRLVSTILGHEELAPEHRMHAVAVMRAIDDTTSYTHELVATYTSYQLLAISGSDDLAAARRELPADYASLLADGERAFGTVGEGSKDDIVQVTAAVIACAVAAMDPLFDVDMARFDRMPHFAQFIRRNSPDRRFRSILKRIKPARLGGGLMAGLLDVPFEEIQPFVFQRLREQLPRITFYYHLERPSLMRDWLAEFAADAQRHGYTFLREVRLGPHPDDTWLERVGARVRMPGLPPEWPLDLSLIRHSYIPSDLTTFEIRAAQLHPAGGMWFAHFIAGAPGMLMCMTMDADMEDLAIEVDPDGLSAAISRMRLGSIAIKIDERWGLDRAAQLAATGHPVFVLLHDTRIKHVHEVISRLGQTQDVWVTVVRMDREANYAALVAHAGQDGFTLLSPITSVGQSLLSNQFRDHERVRFPQRQEEWHAGLTFLTSGTISQRQFQMLVVTTYMSF